LKISKKHLEIKLFGKYTVLMYSYNKIKFSGTNAAPRTPPFAKQSSGALPPLQSLKLLDQLRERIGYLHYSRSTEENYVYWCRFFIRWAGKRHPKDMGKIKGVSVFYSARPQTSLPRPLGTATVSSLSSMGLPLGHASRRSPVRRYQTVSKGSG
jgi:hypothetical protein